MRNGFRVVDAHCHIYPEKIAAKAVAGTDSFYNVHTPRIGTVEEMLSYGIPAGVDRFVVQSVATAPKQVKSINEFIAAEVAAHPDRLTGLGTLHPDSSDIAADVEHLVSLGLHGVKLHPDIQAFKMDNDRCMEMYELCQAAHLPMLIHTGDWRYDYSNPNRLIPVLDAFKDLIIVGAHLGGWSIWEEASALLVGKPNLYVDCSSSFGFLDPVIVRDIMRRYGPDRVLFGTDYPMWTPEKELEYFEACGFEASDKEKMLHINAEKIFGVPKD